MDLVKKKKIPRILVGIVDPLTVLNIPAKNVMDSKTDLGTLQKRMKSFQK